MDAQMEQRIFYLDYIKAFAIILVVIGHVLQYVIWPLDFGEHYMWNFIYSFHMPLFMFVSGFITGIKSSTNLEFTQLMKKKAIQLLLPYFIWAVIVSLLKKDISFIWTIIDRPNYGLWFLWDLFFVILISSVMRYFIKRVSRLICVSIMLFLVMQALRVTIGDHFDYSSISYYLVIFNIGTVIGNKGYNEKLIASKCRYFLILLMLIILYLGTWLFYELGKDVFPYNFPISMYKLLHICNRLGVGIIGSIVFFMVFYLMRNREVKLLKILSRETLGIYAIHFQLIPFVAMGSAEISVPTFVGVIVWSVLILIGSHIVIGIIRLNKYFSLMLLGE